MPVAKTVPVTKTVPVAKATMTTTMVIPVTKMAVQAATMAVRMMDPMRETIPESLLADRMARKTTTTITMMQLRTMPE